MSDEITIGGIIKTIIVSLVVVGVIIGAISGIRQLIISNDRWDAAHPTPPPRQEWTIYKYVGLGVEYFKTYDPSKLERSGDCISGTNIDTGEYVHMCGDYSIEKGDGSDLQ